MIKSSLMPSSSHTCTSIVWPSISVASARRYTLLPEWMPSSTFESNWLPSRKLSPVTLADSSRRSSNALKISHRGRGCPPLTTWESDDDSQEELIDGAWFNSSILWGGVTRRRRGSKTGHVLAAVRRERFFPEQKKPPGPRRPVAKTLNGFLRARPPHWRSEPVRLGDRDGRIGDPVADLPNHRTTVADNAALCAAEGRGDGNQRLPTKAGEHPILPSCTHCQAGTGVLSAVSSAPLFRATPCSVAGKGSSCGQTGLPCRRARTAAETLPQPV